MAVPQDGPRTVHLMVAPGVHGREQPSRVSSHPPRFPNGQRKLGFHGLGCELHHAAFRPENCGAARMLERGQKAWGQNKLSSRDALKVKPEIADAPDDPDMSHSLQASSALTASDRRNASDRRKRTL